MSLLQLFELWRWLRINVILLNDNFENIFHAWCARNFSNQAKLENCLFTTQRAKSRWTSCLPRLMQQILSSGEWYAYKTRSNADASHKGDETKHSQSQSSISCFSFNAILPRKLKAISCYCRREHGFIMIDFNTLSALRFTCFQCEMCQYLSFSFLAS